MTIRPIVILEHLGYDVWEEKYKPVKNHFSKDPDETMFETYGEEVDFVAKADNKYIWTYIQGDYSMLICAGYHYVNRLGYYISSVPWESEDEYVLVSVDSECDCYDEETGEGKDECALCEGSGMITKYVGEDE